MSRVQRSFVVCLVAIAVSALSCSRNGSSVSSPSAVQGTTAGFPIISQGFDLASCLGRSGASGCFSAAQGHATAVAGLTAPGAPVGLTAAVSGSSVTLTWSAPTSGDAVTAYALEAGSASGLANLASVVLGAATAFSASGIPNGTYFVRVKAQNTAGISAASNEAIVTIGAGGCSGVPGPPAGLTVSVSGSTVTLNWSAPAVGCAATSYTLQAGSATGLSNLAASNTGNLATSYIATGVGAGTYFIRLLANNGAGSSGPSNEAIATVGGTTPTPGSSSVTGVVKDAVSGAVIASATVAVQGKSATTGADGKFTISSVADGAATLTATHQGHRNFSQAVTIAGATTVNVTMVTASESSLAGNWSGSWRNNTFNSVGTATGSGTIDTVAQTFTGTWDLNGSVFGAGDPPAQTFSGPYSPTSGMSATGASSFYGTVTMNVTATGQITGTMTSLPQANISKVDLNGTATATTIAINYTVTFSGGGGTASGTVNLTKQ